MPGLVRGEFAEFFRLRVRPIEREGCTNASVAPSVLRPCDPPRPLLLALEGRGVVCRPSSLPRTEGLIRVLLEDGYSHLRRPAAVVPAIIACVGHLSVARWLLIAVPSQVSPPLHWLCRRSSTPLLVLSYISD